MELDGRFHVVKPGRPSDEYLLRKLLYCERCDARMQGARGSRGQRRRYRCGTRCRGGDCTQTMVLAEPLEEQLVEWLRDFRPASAPADHCAGRHPRRRARPWQRRARTPPRPARPARPPPRRLRPILGARSRIGRTAQAAGPTLRPRLARRWHDRSG
ncbi:MAG: zinc ribbon domain-containing protein, partial [Gemmataceae bacterium]|nr:zinc ribbon domain-containing protein [Gemmataceae bacterium]